MSSVVHMADSVRPNLIPSTFKYVAAYANGHFEWTPQEVNRFTDHINIGVLANIPEQAKYCRVLDVERFDALPSDAPAFIQERHAEGHDDATIYCDRATIPSVYQNCRAAGVTVPRWWIATLDGTMRVPVPDGELWAVQYATVNGEYDVSAVYGELDFVHSI
jgi:hypothetical protein